MAEEQDQAQERTEEPTGKREEEFRSQGQIAKSQEIGALVGIVSAVAGIMMWGPKIAIRCLESVQAGMMMPVGQAEGSVHEWLTSYVYPLLFDLSAFILFMFAIVLVGNLTQTGLVLAWKSLEPKPSNISPLSGIKKVFSAQTAVQFVKNILKVFIIGYIIYDQLSDKVASIISLSTLSFVEGISWGIDLILSIVLKVSIFLAVVAAFDYLYQWYSTRKKMMMTKQEVKDELKQTQLPEHVRGKIRQVANERARREIQNEVPHADVVVTNPTHFAVALRYRRGVDAAPLVVAKGQDVLAAHIREIAKKNDVPLYEYPVLARALYRKVKVGRYIPEDLYDSVARVLAYIYRMYAERKKKWV